VTERVADLLLASRTIAVVGLSSKPHRPSYEVAAYLQNQGYRIVPVNPNETAVLGERAYSTLGAARESVGVIDIVDIFRRASEAGAIVDQAIAIHPRLIWLQLGVVDQEAARRGRAAGIPTVMDRCLAVDHRRLLAR